MKAKPKARTEGWYLMGRCKTRVVEVSKHGEVRPGKTRHSERQGALGPATASQRAARRPCPSLGRRVSSAYRSSPEVWQREQNTFLGSVIRSSDGSAGSLALCPMVWHCICPEVQGWLKTDTSWRLRASGQTPICTGCSARQELQHNLGCSQQLQKKRIWVKSVQGLYVIHSLTTSSPLNSLRRKQSKYFVTLGYSDIALVSNLKIEDSKFYLVLYRFIAPLTWGYIYLLLAEN